MNIKKKFEIILIKLFKPSVKIVLICALISIMLLIYIFVYSHEYTLTAYIGYFFSAYSLTILCINFKTVIISIKKFICYNRLTIRIKKFMYKYKYSKMYLDDKEFRAKVSLYVGLGINIFYAIFKCGTGIFYHSMWFGVNGFYYFILGSIRFMLMKNIHITDNREHSKERRIKEYKTYLDCGIMMLLLTIAISGIAIQIICQNEGYSYVGFIIYISAGYTFYSFISSIANVVSFAKMNNPILLATKNLNLAIAIMSVFTLQTSMLSTFKGGETLSRIMNSITGGVVFTFVIGMAIFMIVIATKNIKKLHE